MQEFKRTLNFPFGNDIPNYIDLYLKQISLYKRFFKFYRRWLFIFLKGQRRLEVFKIQAEHKNILWINISAPSIGDSLMDLSSRILIEDRKIDLLTDNKNAHIYREDLFFNNIITNKSKIIECEYDLIIIDSFSSRSIRVKAKVAPKTKFVGMFGYFNGPEVNRTLFSFYQMNNLLGKVHTEDEIKILAKKSINISKRDQEIVGNLIPKKYLSIVMGGEWSYKTYRGWEKVIRKIITDESKVIIVFVGSKNAIDISRNILKNIPEENIINLVNKLSFNQSVEVIRRSQLLFCCDGGLMHAANAVQSKNISLIARLSKDILFTNNEDSYVLHDKQDVNNIKSEQILSKYYQILKLYDNHPQV
mgnify:CR=1 FL=1